MLAGYTAYSANALSYLSDDSAAYNNCHVPNTMELRITRTGSTKVTQHNITSPFKDINAACRSCYTQSEDYLKKQVSDIQKFNPGEITYKVGLEYAHQAGKAGHKAGDRYYEYSNVNDALAVDKLELDKNNRPYNFNKIDPKLSSY